MLNEHVQYHQFATYGLKCFGNVFSRRTLCCNSQILPKWYSYTVALQLPRNLLDNANSWVPSQTYWSETLGVVPRNLFQQAFLDILTQAPSLNNQSNSGSKYLFERDSNSSSKSPGAVKPWSSWMRSQRLWTSREWLEDNYKFPLSIWAFLSVFMRKVTIFLPVIPLLSGSQSCQLKCAAIAFQEFNSYMKKQLSKNRNKTLSDVSWKASKTPEPLHPSTLAPLISRLLFTGNFHLWWLRFLSEGP